MSPGFWGWAGVASLCCQGLGQCCHGDSGILSPCFSLSSYSVCLIVPLPFSSHTPCLPKALDCDPGSVLLLNLPLTLQPSRALPSGVNRSPVITPAEPGSKCGGWVECTAAPAECAYGVGGVLALFWRLCLESSSLLGALCGLVFIFPQDSVEAGTSGCGWSCQVALSKCTQFSPLSLMPTQRGNF